MLQFRTERLFRGARGISDESLHLPQSNQCSDSLPQVRIRYVKQRVVLFTKIHVRAEFPLAAAAGSKAP